VPRLDPDTLAKLATAFVALISIGITWAISKAREMEEWGREFRDIYREFWQNQTLADVRSWIASDILYETVLKRVLERRKYGDTRPEDYKTLEKLDQFCALMARVLSLGTRSRSRVQNRLWLSAYYEYWFKACTKRTLMGEYLDFLWLNLLTNGRATADEHAAHILKRLQYRSRDATRAVKQVLLGLKWSTKKATLQRARSIISVAAPHPLLGYSTGAEIGLVNLSRKNPILKGVELTDPDILAEVVRTEMTRQNLAFVAGGYRERRSFYQRSKTFGSRNVHLGVDLWGRAGDIVYSPLRGRIHGFADNSGLGDYGPTVIVEYVVWDLRFYSLFGHLSRESLTRFKVGSLLERGAQVGTMGSKSENGDWPPHLHFQLILEIGNKTGDYMGVADSASLAEELLNCPDPNWLLGIDALAKKKKRSDKKKK